MTAMGSNLSMIKTLLHTDQMRGDKIREPMHKAQECGADSLMWADDPAIDNLGRLA